MSLAHWKKYVNKIKSLWESVSQKAAGLVHAVTPDGCGVVQAEIGLRLHRLQALSKRDVIGYLLIIQSSARLTHTGRPLDFLINFSVYTADEASKKDGRLCDP
jgi:hypothetical protein